MPREVLVDAFDPAHDAPGPTTALGVGDWLLCAAVASSVLWLRELSKLRA